MRKKDCSVGSLRRTWRELPCGALTAALWLGLFPLLQGGSFRTITGDKRLFFLLLCGLTLAGFAADLARGLLRTPARLPLLAGVLLLCWLPLTCLLSPYGPSAWLAGASTRREGLLTQLCYLLLFFVFLCSRVSLKLLRLSCAAGLAAFFAVVMLQRAGLNPLGLYPPGRSYAANPEFQGTVGNIDMCAGYLTVAAAWLLPAVWDRSVSTGVRLTCLAGTVLAGFLVWTMQVQFGILTFLALLAGCALFPLPRRLRAALCVSLPAALLLLAWFWSGPDNGFREFHEVLHGRPLASFGSNRLGVWAYSLRIAGEQLPFGSGPDTFVLRFGSWLADRGLSLPSDRAGAPLQVLFDTPHNEYIALLFETGLPGLLLRLGLAASVLLPRSGVPGPDAGPGRPRLPEPARLAVAAYLLQAFFSFSSCLVSPLFWVSLGLAGRGQKSFGPPASGGAKHSDGGGPLDDPNREREKPCSSGSE